MAGRRKKESTEYTMAQARSLLAKELGIGEKNIFSSGVARGPGYKKHSFRTYSEREGERYDVDATTGEVTQPPPSMPII